MNFKIFNNNKFIDAKCLYMFGDGNTGISYMIYKTKDSDDILATRYVIENNDIKFKEIKNEYEWDLVDQTIEKITGEL